MAVGPERDGNSRMAQPLLNHSRVDAFLKGERRPSMAEAVEGQPRKAAALDSADKGVAGGVGAEPRAVGAVEDPAFVVEVGADHQALLEHSAAVGPQLGHGGRIESDGAAALARLRLADQDVASRLDHRLHDPGAAGVEVDVAPAQADGLAAAHAGGRQQHPEAVEAIALFGRPGQELAEGAGVPGGHIGRLGTRPGWVGGVGRVPGQAAPADGIPEGPVEDDVDVGDRPRIEANELEALHRCGRGGCTPEEGSQRVLGDVSGRRHLLAELCGGVLQRHSGPAQLDGPVQDLRRVAGAGTVVGPPAGGQKLGVEAVQHAGVDLGQPGAADVGNDVVAHVALVGVERRRADGGLDGRQPVGQEVGNRLAGGLDVVASIKPGQEVDPGPLGVLLGGVAPSATAGVGGRSPDRGRARPSRTSGRRVAPPSRALNRPRRFRGPQPAAAGHRA